MWLLTDEMSRAFVFIGNHACLDFINTEIVQSGQLVDLLVGFEDLVTWLVRAGLLDESTKSVVRWSGSEEERVVERARAFRSTLRQMAGQIVLDQQVPPAAVEAINELLRQRPGHAQVYPQAEGGFQKRFEGEIKEAIHLLVPVAEAACDLLCTSDFSLIKRCENPECVLYFYDTTKNHARRWCSMSGCGNRMKATAYYRRKKSPGEGAAQEGSA